MNARFALKTGIDLLGQFADRQLPKCAHSLKETTTMLCKVKTGAVMALLALGTGALPSVATAQSIGVLFPGGAGGYYSGTGSGSGASSPQFDPGTYYSLICKTSGLALDNGWSYMAKTNETQWHWDPTNANQAWKITGAHDNLPNNPFYYNLTCLTGGMALDNKGSQTWGDNLIQWPLQYGDNYQDWQVQPVANAPSYYNLTCKRGGMALDNRGSQNWGDYVIQWPLQNGNQNQQWKIVPLYSWAAITFTTGDDDLRGSTSYWFGSADSYADITLTINGNAQTFHNVSQDQNWGNDSVHTVYLPLNVPVAWISSGDVKVTLSQWWNGYNSDNWHLQGLSVTLYSGLARGYLERSDTVFSGSGGSSWRQFGTGSPCFDFGF